MILPYFFNYLFWNQCQKPFFPPEHRPRWGKWSLSLILELLRKYGSRNKFQTKNVLWYHNFQRLWKYLGRFTIFFLWPNPTQISNANTLKSISKSWKQGLDIFLIYLFFHLWCLKNAGTSKVMTRIYSY